MLGLTFKAYAIDLLDELSDPESSGLKRCPVGLNGNDPRQGLLRVCSTFDGDSQRGRTFGNVDRLPAHADVRQGRLGQTGRLKKEAGKFKSTFLTVFE